MMKLFGRSFMSHVLVFGILTTIPHVQYVHAAAPAISVSEEIMVVPSVSDLIAEAPQSLRNELKKRLAEFRVALDRLKEGGEKPYRAALSAAQKLFQVSLNVTKSVLKTTTKEVGKSLVSPTFWVELVRALPMIIILTLLIVNREKLTAGYKGAKEAHAQVLAALDKVEKALEATKEIIIQALSDFIEMIKGFMRSAQEKYTAARQAVGGAVSMSQEGMRQLAQSAKESAATVFGVVGLARERLGNLMRGQTELRDDPDVRAKETELKDVIAEAEGMAQETDDSADELGGYISRIFSQESAASPFARGIGQRPPILGEEAETEFVPRRAAPPVMQPIERRRAREEKRRAGVGIFPQMPTGLSRMPRQPGAFGQGSSTFN